MSDDGAQARLDNFLSHLLETAQLARHNRMVHHYLSPTPYCSGDRGPLALYLDDEV